MHAPRLHKVRALSAALVLHSCILHIIAGCGNAHLLECQKTILNSVAKDSYGKDASGIQDKVGLELYVIHSARMFLRRQLLEQAFDRQSLRATFITHPDPDDLSDTDIACMYTSASAFEILTFSRGNFPSSWLNMRELALAIKHFAALYDLLQKGGKHGLVMEDDAILAPALGSRLSALLSTWEAKDEYHVLNLGMYIQPISRDPRQPVRAINRPQPTGESSGVGYVVSSRGAHHVFNNFQGIQGPLDMVLTNTASQHPNGSYVFPTVSPHSYMASPFLIAHGSYFWNSRYCGSELVPCVAKNESGSQTKNWGTLGPWPYAPGMTLCVGPFKRTRNADMCPEHACLASPHKLVAANRSQENASARMPRLSVGNISHAPKFEARLCSSAAPRVPDGGLPVVTVVQSHLRDDLVVEDRLPRGENHHDASSETSSGAIYPSQLEHFGRTAICLTGFPRALNALFGSQTHSSQFQATGEVLQKIAKSWAFAGPRRRPFENNIVATSFHANLFDPLAIFGGFDLFILEPGPLVLPNGSLSFGKPGEYEALRPNTVNAKGEPNRMFHFLGNPEQQILFNSSSRIWLNYFHSKRQGVHHASAKIQSLLHQFHDLKACNQLIKQHTATSKTIYTYKMRVRSDLLFLKPIPFLHTLDFRVGARPTIYCPSTQTFPGAFDQFQVGLADDMDPGFDLYDNVHNYSWLEETPFWSAEGFLEHYLNTTKGIQVKRSSDILTFLVRTDSHCKSRTCVS